MRIKNQSKNKIKTQLVVLAACLFSGIFFINQQLFSQAEPTSMAELKETNGEVDKKAEFPGGKEAMMNFMMKHVRYPKSQLKDNVKETIFVQFVIEKNGKIGKTTVIKGQNLALIEAAVSAVKKMPDWIPAEKDGKKVASSMTLPIKFLPDAPTEGSGFLPGSLNNIRNASNYYNAAGC